jgi:arsenite methyltransferase
MPDEMLELARANQAKAGVENAHWLKGHIEAIPLPAGSVDVIADPDMDDATRADMREYVGCIAGALTREEYTQHLAAAG